MNRAARIALGLSAIAVLLGSYVSYASLYRAPLDDLDTRIRTQQERLETLRAQAIEFADLARPLASTADRTIAADREAITSDLRAILNDLARRAGLTNVRTTADLAQPAVNPASTGRVGEFRAIAQSRDADFVTFTPVNGSLTATGSLEQTLDAIALLESQPWPKRITAAGLEPEGDGLASLRLEFQTVLLPSASPPADRPAIAPKTPEAEQRVRAALRASPFAPPPDPPPPPKPEPKPAQEPPKTPPPPPYDQWVLTLVADASDGPTAILTQRDSGERRVLRPGDSIFGLTFRSIRDTSAVFSEQTPDRPDTVAVQIGRSLAERR